VEELVSLAAELQLSVAGFRLPPSVTER
jgi:hypothetical protein